MSKRNTSVLQLENNLHEYALANKRQRPNKTNMLTDVFEPCLRCFNEKHVIYGALAICANSKKWFKELIIDRGVKYHKKRKNDSKGPMVLIPAVKSTLPDEYIDKMREAINETLTQNLMLLRNYYKST